MSNSILTHPQVQAPCPWCKGYSAQTSSACAKCGGSGYVFRAAVSTPTPVEITNTATPYSPQWAVGKPATYIPSIHALDVLNPSTGWHELLDAYAFEFKAA